MRIGLAEVLCRRIAVWFLVVAAACTTSAERFRRSEIDNRAELAARYPAGQLWALPEGSLGAWERWSLSEPAPSGFAELALAAARVKLPQAPSHCWHGLVDRFAGASIPGGIGCWCDIVFVDADDRVLVAYRCFID